MNDDPDNDESATSELRSEIAARLNSIRGSRFHGNRLEIDLRLKLPGKGCAADYENSRAEAINLNCFACMGGDRKGVRECRSYSCFFWKFRPGAIETVPPPGAIPSRADYARLSEARTAPGSADRLAAARATHKARTAGEPE